jgi:hypothetical protein
VREFDRTVWAGCDDPSILYQDGLVREDNRTVHGNDIHVHKGDGMALCMSAKRQCSRDK